MWAQTPHRVNIKINPSNNFTYIFLSIIIPPHCSHFRFIPFSAAFDRLMPAPHLAANHLPAAAVVIVITIAATVAIPVAINVAATANVSSAAACS